MAVGFPVKDDYVTGDVLTAANMNDLSGSVNLLTSAQYAAGKNAVINSAFQVWQRGTSIATNSYPYTADRWMSGRAGGVGGGTVSRQTTSDTTNLPNIQYCARVQRDSGNTSTATSNFGQPFETVNSIPFAGKTVTLSFYARKGANFSGSSDQIQVYLVTGTGTDQNGITSSYTGAVNAINGQNATLTTTWQRFSFTATLASNITEMNITLNATYAGTAGAADYYEITGVQLEVGSVASPFKTQGVTFQGELAACQRYFQVIGGVSSGFPIVTGYVSASSQTLRWPISFPVQMRTAPTATKNGTWATSNSGQPSASFINAQGFSIEITSTSSGIIYVHPDGTDDTITLSSEL